jgi:hypothetical protein
VSCGAKGASLGVLSSIRSAALFSMSQWPESVELGLAALELLPQGGRDWCATVERLFQMLPILGDVDGYNQLAEEMLRTSPAPGARDAFIRALNVQLLGYALSGRHEECGRCRACIDRVDGGVSERDVVARGYARLWRAIVELLLGNDIPRALELAEQAEQDLTLAQVMYRVSLAVTIESFALWHLGLLELAEQAARRARAIALEVHDDYHASMAAWYIGLAAADQEDEAKREETLRAAVLVQQARVGPHHETHLPRMLTGRVALARRDFARAVDDLRIGHQGIAQMTPYALLISSYEVQALVRSGRLDEAGRTAKAGLAVLAELGGPVCSEVMFEVAAAEALWETGEHGEARRVLARARAHMELRAHLIADADRRNAYLTGREENRRMLELERSWGASH